MKEYIENPQAEPGEEFHIPKEQFNQLTTLLEGIATAWGRPLTEKEVKSLVDQAIRASKEGIFKNGANKE